MTTHIDIELKILRTDIIYMWNLVINQLSKTRKATEEFDRGLATEIAATEKRIDAYELKIDMDCENILALFNPLANELRFVLSVLKINYNLERIGDFAWGIAKIIRDKDHPFSSEALSTTQLLMLFDTSIDMLSEALVAFESEDNQLARSIFSKDVTLDEANREAVNNISGLIHHYPDEVKDLLNLLIVVRKLERAGDHTKNICEEIIFYLEAKVLRHKKKNKNADLPAAES
ncbi:MAG: phosphate signaling complex protein PhoU [Bacteroidales bacterium]|nr:phosphate signaling complex protein PhoU [Lentimicrobiaceae bacterium]MDD5695501.1 phosphate signaling complex protein PhoU [Bacteroidales bacterium]